jgi:dihydroflavonol-4-reductase
MQDPWILVTGASGFIGSTIVRKLVARGEKVKGFVRPGADLRPLAGLPPENFQLAFGEATVDHTVFRALAGCSQLFHAAGTFKLGKKHARETIEGSVLSMRGTLEGARRRGIQNIVVTSSTAALGVARSQEPMDEDHEFNLSDPDPYILAKRRAHDVIEEYVSKGLPVVTVMPSSVYGPGDWKPTPTGAGIVEYLGLSPSVHVPVSTGGLSVADVEDIAEGHVLAMMYGEVGSTYALGGENVTFEQLFQMLADITGLAEPSAPKSPGQTAVLARLLELREWFTGKPPSFTYRLARDYGNAYAWVSSQRAKEQLGYTHRPARETLARAVRWFLQHGYVPEPAAHRVRLELRPI